MKSRRIYLAVVVVALVLLAVAVTWSSADEEGVRGTPLGSSFTYQGQLSDGGGPVTGECEMAFRLYDQATDGSQVGLALTPTVPITDGLFTVQLDFGAVFTGESRWLGIGVRCSGDSVFASLGRQELTATPYALHALSSGALQGHAVSAQAPETGQVLTWDGSEWIPDDAARAGYRGRIVVAKSGGDYDTIQAALDSITSASYSNRYLVWVAPGVYQERVTMKPYVDIAGAGRALTRIRYGGSELDNTGTVVGASWAELRDLTVENTGDVVEGFAVAIYNGNASPRIVRVTAQAQSDGSYRNCGVYNDQNSSPYMEDVIAIADGMNTDNYGVYNYMHSHSVMREVDATASNGFMGSGVFNYESSPVMEGGRAYGNGADTGYGVDNWSSSPEMRGVEAVGSDAGVHNYASSLTMIGVSASGYIAGVDNDSSTVTMIDVTATSEGGSESYGVRNRSTDAVMTNVHASASSELSSSENYGVYNTGSSPTMTHVIATASGPGVSTVNYGVYNKNSSAPLMRYVTAEVRGGAYNYGVYNLDSSPTMTSLSITAFGAHTKSRGMYSESSMVIIRGSDITTDGDGFYNVADSGTYTVTIDGCQISAVLPIYNDFGDDNVTTLIGATLLDGDPVFGLGTTICAGVYDEDYQFYPDTCP
jgi:hypothetical protein